MDKILTWKAQGGAEWSVYLGEVCLGRLTYDLEDDGSFDRDGLLDETHAVYPQTEGSGYIFPY